MTQIVGIEVNAARADALEFRVSNCGSEETAAVRLGLGSAALELGPIAAGESKQPVAPCGAGCGVELSVGEHVYRGLIDLEMNIHRIESYAGNDLAGMLRVAGDYKELNEDRVREKIARGEPWWIRIGLELDEEETARRSAGTRRYLTVPDGTAPARCTRGLLECADPAAPRRIFLYSAPEVRFGRATQRNDAVIRFLPDFFTDERSKTISSEQFVVRAAGGRCALELAPQGHAPLIFNGHVLMPGKAQPLADGDEIRIGTHEFTLAVVCAPRAAGHDWLRTRELTERLDPGADPFAECPWDCVRFPRPANGGEEEYCWLFRKVEFGWSETAGLQLGLPAARLSHWNGRYYLEACDPAVEVKAGGRRLGPGDVACLGAGTEITIGTRALRWSLVQG